MFHLIEIINFNIIFVVFYSVSKLLFPRVDAAEMLKETPNIVDENNTDEPKKKKKKQKVGFRDRKV